MEVSKMAKFLSNKSMFSEVDCQKSLEMVRDLLKIKNEKGWESDLRCYAAVNHNSWIAALANLDLIYVMEDYCMWHSKERDSEIIKWIDGETDEDADVILELMEHTIKVSSATYWDIFTSFKVLRINNIEINFRLYLHTLKELHDVGIKGREAGRELRDSILKGDDINFKEL